MGQMKLKTWPRRSVAVLGVLAFSVSAGAVVAAAHSSGAEPGTVHSCRVVSGANRGVLRVVDAAEKCKSNETALDWNAVGPIGATGAVGPIGPTGADGPAGPIGPAGADGADGADGAIGPAGADGNDGAQGAPGQIGPAGEPGVDGADGATGATGAPGGAGAAGKSAYELAVDGGFVGTQEQWLASLDGTDGIDGAPGIVPAASCPANQFVTGVAAGGALVCSALPTTVVPDPDPLPGCYNDGFRAAILWTGTDGVAGNATVFQGTVCTGIAFGGGTIFLTTTCPAGMLSPLSLSGFSPAFPAPAVFCVPGGSP